MQPRRCAADGRRQRLAGGGEDRARGQRPPEHERVERTVELDPADAPETEAVAARWAEIPDDGDGAERRLVRAGERSGQAEQVGARAAQRPRGAVQKEDLVVAVAAFEQVGAGRSRIQEVVAVAAAQRVVPLAAEEGVVARSAVEGADRAAAGNHDVVAAEGEHDGALGAGRPVLAVGEAGAVRLVGEEDFGAGRPDERGLSHGYKFLNRGQKAASPSAERLQMYRFCD